MYTSNHGAIGDGSENQNNCSDDATIDGRVHLSVWQCSIRTQVRATKLDEAADKVNAQAIVAAFTPFLNTKVRQMDAARG